MYSINVFTIYRAAKYYIRLECVHDFFYVEHWSGPPVQVQPGIRRPVHSLPLVGGGTWYFVALVEPFRPEILGRAGIDFHSVYLVPPSYLPERV